MYIRSSFDPGGTESLLLNLFNYSQNEIQFHYAFLKNGSLISRLKSDQNKYYKVFRESKIDYRVLYKLSKIIKTENIKVVHTHQMFELLYAVLLKIKHPTLSLFHTVHGYHDEHSRWAENLERFLILFTKKAFTVSHATKSILEKKGYPVKKIEVLYNAVTIPEPADGLKLDGFKKHIYYQTRDFIIGMIGNFVWQKDQLTIIKAFNIIKQNIPQLKVVLIGKESELSEKCKTILAKKDIDHRVFFMGAIENASQYLPLFDVFIMSTLMDTFGIVVVEALMSKIPVIASDIEVMKELSHNGEYFDLFEKQSSNDLADKIKEIYKERENSKVGIAYRYVIAEYSYENYLNHLINYYRDDEYSSIN